MKCQSRPLRSNQENCDPADQVSKIMLPDTIGNDHHRKKRHQRSEQQAVDEYDQSGLFQVLKLGVSNLAVDLSQGFLAAHSQDRVPEAHEDDNESQQS